MLNIKLSSFNIHWWGKAGYWNKDARHYCIFISE